MTTQRAAPCVGIADHHRGDETGAVQGWSSPPKQPAGERGDPPGLVPQDDMHRADLAAAAGLGAPTQSASARSPAQTPNHSPPRLVDPVLVCAGGGSS